MITEKQRSFTLESRCECSERCLNTGPVPWGRGRVGLIFRNELLLDGKGFTFKNWPGFTTKTEEEEEEEEDDYISNSMFSVAVRF